MIDLYCERTGADFWAEPLNAVTNLAFIIAAVAILWQALRSQTLQLDLGVLIGLLFMIGIGSGLFHLFATRETMLADVLPILGFQVVFLLTYGRRVIGLSGGGCFRLFMMYVLLTILCSYLPSSWLNGTLSYAPAFMFLLGFGVYHYVTRQPMPFVLLTAAGIFLVSMTFRSIDQSVCQDIPIGTHFLWHIFNALVLYLCLYSLILKQKSIS